MSQPGDTTRPEQLIFNATRRHNLADLDMCLHRHENFKSYTKIRWADLISIRISPLSPLLYINSNRIIDFLKGLLCEILVLEEVETLLCSTSFI